MFSLNLLQNQRYLQLLVEADKNDRRSDENRGKICHRTSNRQKDSREHVTPGIGRRSLRTLKDVNDNNVVAKTVDKKEGEIKTEAKKDTKGAEAAVDLKSEAAKRRQRELIENFF